MIIKDKLNIPIQDLKSRFKNNKEADAYSNIINQIIDDKKYNPGYLNYFENDRFIISDYKTFPRGMMNGILWDKKLGNGFTLGTLSYSPNFSPNFNYSYENTVVRIWGSEQAFIYKKDIVKDENLLNGYPKDLYESIKDIEADDNPILIFYQFKETNDKTNLIKGN